MQTLLLLAGRSRRFWPLSEKSLWPFLGKPLLHHQLERLKAGGLQTITIVSGQHNLEQVYSYFPGVSSIEQENLDLGMRGALLSAVPQMKEGPVCIVSGNDVIDPDGYQSLIRASQTKGVDGAILVQRVKKYFPGGYIVVSPDHASWFDGAHHDVRGGVYPERSRGAQHDVHFPRVAGIVEKPGEGKEPSDLVNIVAHVHNHPEKLLEALENVSSERDDAYEVALSALCKKYAYVAVPYEGKWHSLKYPWHVLDLTERFLNEMRKCENAKIPKYEIHPTAVIEGPVILEEGVKVMAHATVQGPCFIGKGTVIGTNALVRSSIIGEGCVIGFGSEIARSNLHSHVWTHTTYLGDSVVGRNVAFGAGTVTANFRLDEGEIPSVVNDAKIPTQRTKLGAILGDDVRVGIHVSFAPGVKVGKKSFISSVVFVSHDVPENKYVMVKQGVLDVRENRTSAPGVRSEL